MGRLVVVSNRVAAAGRSAGGLAVALKAGLDTGGLWFGWNGGLSEAGPTPASLARQTRAGITYATVPLTEDQHRDYYLGFANSALWPMLHMRPDLVRFDTGQFEVYRATNAALAEVLVSILEPDDAIWVHDYHLIPLGAELRRLGARQRIGFFLHVPFPSDQVVATLPRHERLVRALFAYDLVGFQTEADLGNFTGYLHREVGIHESAPRRFRAPARSVQAGVFPVGIDVSEVQAMVASPEAQALMTRLGQELAGRPQVLGVDRLDYSKGLPQRLRAFRLLLDKYPGLRGQVTMLQIAAPSRTDVKAYADIRGELAALAGTINGEMSQLDWTPIRHLTRSVSRTRGAALCRLSRVGLVTPLRDGMNLVAKEYVSAQDPDDPGVLVLSRFAGAAERLTAAVLVNPYDEEQVADALHAALRMPRQERRERHAELARVVASEDVHWWMDRFRSALQPDPPPTLAGPRQGTGSPL